MMPTNEGHWNRFRRGLTVLLAGAVICSSAALPVAAAEAAPMEQNTVTTEEAADKAAEATEMFDTNEVDSSDEEWGSTQTDTVEALGETENTTEEESVKETKSAAESTVKETKSAAESTVKETESAARVTESTVEVTKGAAEKTEATQSYTEYGADLKSETTAEDSKKAEVSAETEAEVDSTEMPEVTEDSVSTSIRGKNVEIDQQLAAEEQALASETSMLSRSVSAISMNNFTPEKEIAQISRCEINGSTKKINLTATINGAVEGNTVYLMELGAYEYSLDGKKPVASASVSGNTVALQTDLGENNTTGSKLYSKFVLAYLSNGRYISISDPSYITNPEAISLYDYDFPTASSKKGLQTSIMISDTMDLGVPNVAFNLRLEEFISDSSGVAFSYKGKTYYFNQERVSTYDRLLKEYYDNDMVVTMIILLGKASNTQGLIYDSASDTMGYSPSNYAIDTSNKEDAEWVEAIMTFLGTRYTREDAKYGQVVNWILGNEINTPRYYNWMGPVELETYAAETARTYRIFTTALRSCYSNVRTYFSMDFFWGTIPNNPDPLGSFSTRELLDQLDANLKAEGEINWNLAYHAYPYPFEDPAFWDDDSSVVNSSVDSRIINLNNIDVLTNYVKENYGEDTRILLSEEGFTSSNSKGENLQEKQAAAYAYAYYITEAQDMIDALIITRHVDHVGETSQNFYFGLWTNETGAMEKADRKKTVWEVFKYIDTPKSFNYTNSLLKYVDGVNAWNSSAPRLSGLDDDLFESMPEKESKSVYEPSSYQSAVQMDTSAWSSEYFDINNKNVYSGYINVLEQKADFTDKSAFLTKVNITSASSGNADVKIRVTAGDSYYEADGTYSVAALNSGKLIGVDLSSWEDRNKVTKIQVWVRIQGQGNCTFTLRECAMDVGKDTKVPVTEDNSTSDDNNNLSNTVAVIGNTHVQNIGWIDNTSGGIIGTEGRGLQMEALKLNLSNAALSGGISYSTHVKDIGWQDEVANGETAGTEGKGLRMEAIKINLTGKISEEYDIYYRAHVQNIGWQDWVKNGEIAGTENRSLQIEALEILLLKKESSSQPLTLVGASHVQNIGWVNNASGGIIGTEGRGLQVEALKLWMWINDSSLSGGINYSAHVKNLGWLNPVSNGEIAGTQGRSLRVEALKINLTGEIANQYDVYYRTHVQNIGWQNWVKNGEMAGTENRSLQVEALEIMLVKKGETAPSN